MKAFMILVIIFLRLSVYAHDPTEITYVFESDEMTIHWTPKGALDLISSIHPNLVSQESIHLSSYIQDYQDYFNDRIDIQSAGRSIHLEYLMSDLTKHDSFIRFRLLDFDEDYRETLIIVSAFEDVYQHVSNIIKLPLGSGMVDSTLLEETGFGVLKEKFIEFENPLMQYWLPMVTSLIMFLGFVWFIIWGMKKLFNLIL